MLSILGPVAFAFSVWDGFQSTLGQWFTRYISVYLWLPVSDLFSTLLAKLQVLMLRNDIQELQGNPDYSIDNSNSVYIIFMLIGIIGYFTVPTVAGWIVQAGGAGNFSRNLNRTATKAGSFAAGVGGSVLGNIGGRLRGNNRDRFAGCVCCIRLLTYAADTTNVSNHARLTYVATCY